MKRLDRSGPPLGHGPGVGPAAPPERDAPGIAAVARENRGFDLISRRPHPEDAQTAIEIRSIEVKGRADVGEVALSANEYRTAGRLGRDYWLYAVFNCGGQPEVHSIQNPARWSWKPVMAVEQYRIGVAELMEAVQ